MTWRGECDACGGEVVWVGDQGNPDVPVGQEKVLCLSCLCFGGFKIQVEAPAERELREAGLRRAA